MSVAEPAGAGAGPTGVRLALSVGPADVGARVVVRRRTSDGRLGDLLGVLRRWDDELVVVRGRTGGDTAVLPADVVAAKRVPPAPARRPAVRE